MNISPRSAAFVVTCCALLLVLTSCFSLPVDARLLPKNFHTEIGGVGPGSSTYSVTLENGSLYYQTSTPVGDTRKTFTTKFNPTNEQWKEFRISLDAIQVWKWQQDYAQSEVKGGSRWGLTIEYADHTLATHGENGFPGDEGRPNPNPSPSKAFRDYCAAVKKLLGDEEFH